VLQFEHTEKFEFHSLTTPWGYHALEGHGHFGIILMMLDWAVNPCGFQEN
jgi:hypothetical protein